MGLHFKPITKIVLLHILKSFRQDYRITTILIRYRPDGYKYSSSKNVSQPGGDNMEYEKVPETIIGCAYPV